MNSEFDFRHERRYSCCCVDSLQVKFIQFPTKLTRSEKENRKKQLLNKLFLKADQVKTGLGNLSTKNRLRDRFSGSKSRQVTGQRFSGRNFRQESRTGF